ncbi:DUF6624 domain-containing protein [Streptomyces noursei]|uniref:DUF6624 domain-containing protein n=1 Tax=Streptomyces noursei TaxID=1971 RepID=UPI0038209787
MTEQPRRPDIAYDLVRRAHAAREQRRKLPLALLSAAEIGMGRHQDHANAQVLRRIVGEHGWPGRSLVGEEAAEAAWQIALYADHLPDFQRLSLRLLSDAVDKGEASLRQWAHLHDRCSVSNGVPQVYGTQHRLGPGGVVERLPVREPERLDERRASVGLPPLAAVRGALCHRRASEQADEAADAERSIALVDTALQTGPETQQPDSRASSTTTVRSEAA